jgi:hypothetical protein
MNYLFTFICQKPILWNFFFAASKINSRNFVYVNCSLRKASAFLSYFKKQTNCNLFFSSRNCTRVNTTSHFLCYQKGRNVSLTIQICWKIRDLTDITQTSIHTFRTPCFKEVKLIPGTGSKFLLSKYWKSTAIRYPFLTVKLALIFFSTCSLRALRLLLSSLLEMIKFCKLQISLLNFTFPLN